MPHVFEDVDFQVLKDLINNLHERDKRLTMAEQRSLATALLFIAGRAARVHRPHDDDALTDDIDGVVVKASVAFASLLDHLANELGGVVMGKVNGVPWFYVDELAPEACGFIPSFLDVDDGRPLKEQINDNYIGGWHKFEGFQIKSKSWTIAYPGDPDMQPLAGAALHGEVIAVYPYAWVMIVREDNSFEIARLD
jgi:hypothetical protein